METSTWTNNETSSGINGDSNTNVMLQAASFLTYKIGDALARYYLKVFLPIGVTGNLLSLLIMMQKHNRQMSFSLYINALAITDTITLVIGCKDFLLDDHLTTLPSTFWYCTIWVTVASFSNLCSTLFLLSMTFDRFYSIIRPHKAASFNTVKRAKVTITCVIVFSSLFNIPHLFATAQRGRRCNPIGKVSEYPYLRAYSWLTSGLNCFLPFLLLLIMNILIINALHRHSKFIGKPKMGQGQGQGQNNEQVQSRVLKVKHAERQITVTLLFVTFTFLVLMFPYGSILIYVVVYDFTKSPQSYAGYILFAGIANRAYFTNSGINFFLYVISGKKFREDLVNLFRCKSKYGRRGGGSRAVTSGREGDTGITSISSAM